MIERWHSKVVETQVVAQAEGQTATVLAPLAAVRAAFEVCAAMIYQSHADEARKLGYPPPPRPHILASADV